MCKWYDSLVKRGGVGVQKLQEMTMTIWKWKKKWITTKITLFRLSNKDKQENNISFDNDGTNQVYCPYGTVISFFTTWASFHLSRWQCSSTPRQNCDATSAAEQYSDPLVASHVARPQPDRACMEHAAIACCSTPGAAAEFARPGKCTATRVAGTATELLQAPHSEHEATLCSLHTGEWRANPLLTLLAPERPQRHSVAGPLGLRELNIQTQFLALSPAS